MEPIAKALESLYSAFGDVPKPSRIEGCPCCLDQEEIRILLSKPLRELTGGELASYSESALLTVGSTEDYLYFLPRILEIGCVVGGYWPDIEITGRAISETTPLEWPGHRRDALALFLHAVLQSEIEEESGWGIDGLICAIGRMGLDVMPFLLRIESSTAAFLDYYEHNSNKLKEGKLGNAFWDAELPGFHVVVEWFRMRMGSLERQNSGD